MLKTLCTSIQNVVALGEQAPGIFAPPPPTPVSQSKICAK